MSKWQDISTAPKDGSNIWLFCPDETPHQFTGFWTKYVDFEPNESGGHDSVDRGRGGWSITETDSITPCRATHWQPLPLPPQAQGEIEEPRSGDDPTATDESASLTQKIEQLEASLALCERRAEEAESRVTFYESELVKTAMALAKITDELRALREGGR